MAYVETEGAGVMAKLKFECCYVSAESWRGEAGLDVGGLRGGVEVNGNIDEETGALYLSICGGFESLSDDEFLETHAIIEGLVELEALHAYLGFIISQYKSLQINKK